MRLVLILIRHGEAVEATSESKDHGRVLTPKGQRQARSIGAQLAAAGHQPTLALVSDAARTKETWRGVVDGAGSALAQTALEFQRIIYSGEVKQLLQLVGKVDAAKHHAAVLVGHNPGISEVAGDLCGQYLRFNTADCVLLSLEADSWAEAVAQQGSWELVVLMQPGV